MYKNPLHKKVEKALLLFNELQEKYPQGKKSALLEKAIRHFDLSPLEENALRHHILEKSHE